MCGWVCIIYLMHLYDVCILVVAGLFALLLWLQFHLINYFTTFVVQVNLTTTITTIWRMLPDSLTKQCRQNYNKFY